MFRLAWHVGGLCVCLGAAMFAFPEPEDGPAPRDALDELLRELDQDGNGRIAPYEGADALLLLLKSADQNGDGGVDATEIEASLADAAREREEENAEWYGELDVDADGSVRIESEVPEDFRFFAELADTDGNGVLTLAELAEFEPSTAAMAAGEAAAILAEDDENGDGRLSSEELHEDDRDEMLDFADADGDGVITRDELEAALILEGQPASFAVEGDRCVMTGVIGPTTPGRVLELVCEHPEVEVIEMREVQGSMDDTSNLRAARMIRKHGLATHVPRDGVIASGGVDFFLAGAKRTVVDGARLGVHSWGDRGLSGVDVPRDDPEHRLYLDFYEEMGTPASFYWYTLEAAGPRDIHWMTPDEIALYGVLTTVEEE